MHFDTKTYFASQNNFNPFYPYVDVSEPHTQVCFFTYSIGSSKCYERPWNETRCRSQAVLSHGASFSIVLTGKLGCKFLLCLTAIVASDPH